MRTEEITNKPKNLKKVLKGVLAYLRPNLNIIILATILMLSANILMLIGPYFSGKAVDAMGLGGSFRQVVKFSLFMALSYIISGILQFVLTKTVIRLAQKTTGQMRQDTFNKIVDLPLAYIDTHHAGDLVSRISYDLSLVNQSISNHIFQILASVITVFGSLFMMISISADLALMFIFLLPLTIAFTIYRMKKTRPLFSKRSRLLGKMNSFVEEILYGQRTISAYDSQDYFSGEFERVNKESMEAYYQADYQASINMPSVGLITNLSLAFIAMVGAVLFIRGEVTLGTLTSFILYSRKFSGPINEAAGIVSEIQSSLSAGERVFNLLDEPSEPADSKEAVDLDKVKGEIEFKNVSFAYDPAKPIIKNFSIKAEEGSLTAIVGPTGSGKSTLINLLMRFYDVDEGQILIDGIPIKEISRESLRESFAMVLQDSWLFQGTIKENIAYGRPEASDEEIRKASEAAHIDSFIDSLPDGYENYVSDGAGNLSQGQKQLISIARAMVLDAPMLILDEATSNVDSRTEIKIQDAMNKLIEGRTSIVIAHRLSTIQKADNIIVLVNGEIKEQGTHQDLLKKDGFYKDLYDAQFA